MKLHDEEVERRTLQILWEEIESFGAEHGRELWERLQLSAEDFATDPANTIAMRIEQALAKNLAPLAKDETEREYLRIHEIESPLILDALAKQTQNLASRRALMRISQGLARDAHESELDESDMTARAEQAIRSIRSRGDHWRPLSESLARVRTFLEEKQDGKLTPSVATGFPQIDEATAGLNPTLIVIAAMPGVGKSAFVGSILRNMAMRGETPAVFCMEDRSDWLVFRFLAHDSGVHQFIARNRPLYPDQWREIGDAWSAVAALGSKILCDDREGLTPGDVLFAARAAIRKGAKAIFLDNMTSMRFSRGPRMDLEIQDFLVAARALANKTQVPFVVLSHVRRREGLDAGKMPHLTDCTETSAYEKICRLAYGLARNPETNQVEIGVLKNTNGESHISVKLQLRPSSALLEAEMAREAKQAGLPL